MLKLGFCTTAMNRKGSVALSVPHNLRAISHYPDAVILLLDYNSSDGLEEFVQTAFAQPIAEGRLIYCRTSEPRYFHMSHAKNVAHKLAILERSPEVLINTDAEMLLTDDFPQRLNELFLRQPLTVLTNHSGRIAIHSEDFLKLGGYDESFQGWGVEDNDLRHRAQRHGVAHLQESSGNEIHHSDFERTINYPPELQHAGRTNAANYALFQQNNANSVIEANRGRSWGSASVLVNWAKQVSI